MITAGRSLQGFGPLNRYESLVANNREPLGNVCEWICGLTITEPSFHPATFTECVFDGYTWWVRMTGPDNGWRKLALYHHQKEFKSDACRITGNNGAVIHEQV